MDLVGDTAFSHVDGAYTASGYQVSDKDRCTQFSLNGYTGQKKLSNVPDAVHMSPRNRVEEARETKLKPIDSNHVHNPIGTGNADILRVHEVCDTLIRSTSSSVCRNREQDIACYRVYEVATE